MKNLVAILIGISITSTLSFGQKTISDTNHVFWSKDRRLQQSDFQIKVGSGINNYSFGQYSFDYNVGGAFTIGLSKNYKKSIRTYLIKSASWIDTTQNTNLSIAYQQTLFDLSEIYSRHFRKSVFNNRKKIVWGKLDVNTINTRIMTDFSNRRVQYDLETNFGTIAKKQKEWELLIAKELESLNEFAID